MGNTKPTIVASYLRNRPQRCAHALGYDIEGEHVSL
jgi:hypothetical protein